MNKQRQASEEVKNHENIRTMSEEKYERRNNINHIPERTMCNVQNEFGIERLSFAQSTTNLSTHFL